jgi:hypothetical protein
LAAWGNSISPEKLIPEVQQPQPELTMSEKMMIWATSTNIARREKEKNR